VIVDRDVGALRAEMNRDLRWLVAGSGGLALVLVALIALVVRVGVLRRLQRFETTARLIAAGDLERRVPASGSDTISWLAASSTPWPTRSPDCCTRLAPTGAARDGHHSIDDGIVVLDAERKVIAANEAFLRRTGEVRPRSWDVLPQGAHGGCNVGDCPTVACFDSGERQIRICERRTLDGKVAWEEVHASPIQGPAGEIAQVVEVWRDISDRRAAEARLAEAHRLGSLGLLASGFSHELNTPLGRCWPASRDAA